MFCSKMFEGWGKNNFMKYDMFLTTILNNNSINSQIILIVNNIPIIKCILKT